MISAMQRAVDRQPVPGFPDRSILPADARLAGISCVSASFCLTAGGYADALGRNHSLAEEWNGRRWRILPGVHGIGLSDVSCTSTTFCLALGSRAQRWDGRTWTATRTPRPAPGRDLVHAPIVLHGGWLGIFAEPFCVRERRGVERHHVAGVSPSESVPASDLRIHPRVLRERVQVPGGRRRRGRKQ